MEDVLDLGRRKREEAGLGGRDLRPSRGRRSAARRSGGTERLGDLVSTSSGDAAALLHIAPEPVCRSHIPVGPHRHAGLGPRTDEADVATAEAEGHLGGGDESAGSAFGDSLTKTIASEMSRSVRSPPSGRKGPGSPRRWRRPCPARRRHRRLRRARHWRGARGGRSGSQHTSTR